MGEKSDEGCRSGFWKLRCTKENEFMGENV